MDGDGRAPAQGAVRQFGIPKFELLCAEGLDDERVDAQARMDEALARADALGKTF